MLYTNHRMPGPVGRGLDPPGGSDGLGAALPCALNRIDPGACGPGEIAGVGLRRLARRIAAFRGGGSIDGSPLTDRFPFG